MAQIEKQKVTMKLDIGLMRYIKHVKPVTKQTPEQYARTAVIMRVFDEIHDDPDVLKIMEHDTIQRFGLQEIFDAYEKADC